MGIMSTISKFFTRPQETAPLAIPEMKDVERSPSIYAEAKEIGSTGVQLMGGWVREAYSSELFWPSVAPLYLRIWRSDPEVTVARVIMETLASKVQLGVELPEHEGTRGQKKKPSDDDKKARDFMYECLDDIEGGIQGWLTSCMSRVPFFGWGWWEALPGIRSETWRPPDSDDTWRSQYDDGLIGYRRLAFRHYSSFFQWDGDDKSGRVNGMIQLAPPNSQVTIPLNRSLHVKFGDRDNPEGLATLEAMWRLERLKYGLEIVQGIGFEHAAGYLDVVATKTLTDQDKNYVRQAARAVLTAQEGNYALWPNGFTGELKDVPFQASTSILEAIRYYGILKLALLGMQWAALGTLSPYGSFATMSDASSLFLTTYNAMVEGFVDQVDQQLGRRLFSYEANKAAFPGMTRRPKIVVLRRVEKNVKLAELGQFLQAISTLLPMDDEDLLAIRRSSEVLPDRLPEHGKVIAQPVGGTGAMTPQAPGGAKVNPVVKPAPKKEEKVEEKASEGELALRTVGIPPEEQPTDVSNEAIVDENTLKKAVSAFKKWAKENAPEFTTLLDAKVVEGKNGTEPHD